MPSLMHKPLPPRFSLTPQVILHFAKGTPHPDITVVVVSFLNFNSGPVTNLEFQAAVPKVCLLVDLVDGSHRVLNLTPMSHLPPRRFKSSCSRRLQPAALPTPPAGSPRR